MSKHYPRLPASVLAIALSALLSNSALASVSLADYGLRDVEATATCVHQRITSAAGSVVVHMYWSPAVFVSGRCTPPREALSSLDSSNARSQFLTALSSCTGRQVTNDADNGIRRIGDATAILIADGIRDALTNVSLLERFNRESEECHPRQKKN